MVVNELFLGNCLLHLLGETEGGFANDGGSQGVSGYGLGRGHGRNLHMSFPWVVIGAHDMCLIEVVVND